MKYKKMLKVANLTDATFSLIEDAVEYCRNGDPVKDVLSEDQVIECMVALHDILIAQKQKEQE